jgi:hypothetical protein
LAASGLHQYVPPVRPSESVLGELARAAIAGETGAVWEIVRRIDDPETRPTLIAELRVPTPIPAAWAAYALADFDRSFRWSVRSAEADRPVDELRRDGRRPALTYRGIELVEVSPGSWQSRLDPSSPLQRIFQRKTWVVVGGVMTALTLADWEISQIVAALNPHSDRPEIIYVREPAAPASPDVRVRVTGEIEGRVTIQVDGTTITLQASPGERWMPDEARQRRSR